MTLRSGESMSRADYSHAARQRHKRRSDDVSETKTVKRTERFGEGDTIAIRLTRVGTKKHTIIVTVPSDVEDVRIYREGEQSAITADSHLAEQ